jgi:hypothetical protein
MNAGKGTFLAYGTAPGRSADENRNSDFYFHAPSEPGVAPPPVLVIDLEQERRSGNPTPRLIRRRPPTTRWPTLLRGGLRVRIPAPRVR